MAIQAPSAIQQNDYFQNPSNSYYIYPNENPALVLVSLILNEKNARAMKMTLLSKNKIRFIDGTLLAPAMTDQMHPA